MKIMNLLRMAEVDENVNQWVDVRYAGFHARDCQEGYKLSVSCQV